MKRFVVVVLLLLAMGAVLGRVYWSRARGPEVTLGEVTRGRVVEAVYATGRIDSDRRTTVRARLTGTLAALRVGAGSPVRAGEVVGEQDPTEQRLTAERAARDLAAARAAAASAHDAASRAAKLAHDGLIAEGEFVRLTAAEAQSVEEVAALSKALDLAREKAGWSTLRAPQAGVVAQLLRRAGDPLREGDDVLTIVDLADAYLRVAVDERDVGRIAVGQEARLVFDAWPGKVLTGRVWRLVPAVDRLTKTADVLVQLPAERPGLKLDMTATVNIVTRTVEDAVLVSKGGLEGNGAERTAWIVEGERAVKRKVAIGACDEDRCQATSGLSAGERTIVPLPAGLAEGARVRVKP